AAFTPLQCTSGREVSKQPWPSGLLGQPSIGNIPQSAFRTPHWYDCALENRYIRYIVANQQLKPLQISYTSVTSVTSLSISNLTQPTASQPATFSPKKPN